MKKKRLLSFRVWLCMKKGQKQSNHMKRELKLSNQLMKVGRGREIQRKLKQRKEKRKKIQKMN